jgi:hypothetical protein
MQTYRANLFVVLLSVVMPGGFFAAGAEAIYFEKTPLGLAEILLLIGLFFAWVLLLAYLAVLRVDLDTGSITYQNLFRGRRLILRSEISSVINERHKGSETTTYALIVTPRIDSGKSSMKIPLFFLNLRATNELPTALSAKERDSTDLLTLT